MEKTIANWTGLDSLLGRFFIVMAGYAGWIGLSARVLGIHMNITGG
jgi:hypothetical protein